MIIGGVFLLNANTTVSNKSIEVWLVALSDFINYDLAVARFILLLKFKFRYDFVVYLTYFYTIILLWLTDSKNTMMTSMTYSWNTMMDEISSKIKLMSHE